MGVFALNYSAGEVVKLPEKNKKSRTTTQNGSPAILKTKAG
jgi:hypothetical protein